MAARRDTLIILDCCDAGLAAARDVGEEYGDESCYNLSDESDSGDDDIDDGESPADNRQSLGLDGGSEEPGGEGGQDRIDGSDDEGGVSGGEEIPDDGYKGDDDRHSNGAGDQESIDELDREGIHKSDGESHYDGDGESNHGADYQRDGESSHGNNSTNGSPRRLPPSPPADNPPAPRLEERKELIGACGWGIETWGRTSPALWNVLDTRLATPGSNMSTFTLVSEMNSVLAKRFVEAKRFDQAGSSADKITQAVHYVLRDWDEGRRAGEAGAERAGKIVLPNIRH